MPIFVVWDCLRAEDAIATMAPRVLVIKAGRITIKADPRGRAVASGMSGAVLGRAAGLLALLVLGAMVLARGLTPAEGGVLAFVHLVNLVFHEAGHVILACSAASSASWAARSTRC